MRDEGTKEPRNERVRENQQTRNTHVSVRNKLASRGMEGDGRRWRASKEGGWARRGNVSRERSSFSPCYAARKLPNSWRAVCDK